MNKKLPSVFVNAESKSIENNQKYFYSKEENYKIRKKEIIDIKKRLELQKKINDLFTLPRFVYKLPVLVKTTNNELVTTIVAKKGNNLLTLDNNLINIDDIIEINER